MTSGKEIAQAIFGLFVLFVLVLWVGGYFQGCETVSYCSQKLYP